MSTTSDYMTVRGIDIDVVYPPMGRVRVAAPERLNDDQVRLAVIQRLPWIKRQQDQLRAAERQSKREMVTGESHFVWGARRRLKVIERPGRAHLELDGERLLLYVPEDTVPNRRLELLDLWYREQLRAAVPSLIAKWEPKLNVSVARWSIRRMKTKWGSCNRTTGHIWFNVELAKKHPDCLEYIVVHEMVHLIERRHNGRFEQLMSGVMPTWRLHRDELNRSPLAHENWTY